MHIAILQGSNQIRCMQLLSKGQLKVKTHLEFIPQLQTFVVLTVLIVFTIELSVIYFSLLLTIIKGE